MSQYFVINDFDEEIRKTFPQPSSMVFKKYHIVNKDRTLDGTLVVDYINSKEIIDVTWGMLADRDFSALQELIERKKEEGILFYDISFIKAGKPEKNSSGESDGNDNQQQNKIKTMDITAYTEEISYYPYFTGDGKVVWRDVSISFVQE